MVLDRIDKQILNTLQENGKTTNSGSESGLVCVGTHEYFDLINSWY